MSIAKTSWRAAACAVALLINNLAAAAQEPKADTEAAGKLIDDFTSLCTVAIFRPEDAMAGALLRGYSDTVAAPVNAKLKAFGGAAAGGRASLNISIAEFSDYRSVFCQLSSMAPLSIDDLKRLTRQVESADGIGTMEGDIGMPKDPEGGASAPQDGFIFGNYKRPGNDPAIFLNLMSNSSYTNLTLTLAQPKPMN